MISKEERAEWRESAKNTIYAEPVNSAHSKLANRIFLLCDALEAAEARAEAAERERNVLAGYIVEITEACTYAAHFYAISEKCADCDENKPYVPCWLEWARQQAREEKA